MSTIKVADKDGDTIFLLEVDGYRFSTFGNKPEETLKIFNDLPKMTFRKDDILLCAPMKSGTHWSWEVVSMLQNGSAQYMEGNKMERMLEARTQESLETVPSPRVLNSHIKYRFLPKDLEEKKCKIVFIVRNPKDMVVSWYNHDKGLGFYEYDGKFENFVQLFFNGQLEYGCYFEYMLEWQRVLAEMPDRVHLLYYEDLMENPVAEVERIARFIGVKGERKLYQEIADCCSFSNMAAKREYSDHMTEIFKGGFSFFRKGSVGGWKDWFTVALNEEFDRVLSEKFKDSKFKFRYEIS